MEVSQVRKRVLDTINAARKSAAERRARADEAGRAYEQFLESVAVPLFRQIANALRAEGHVFSVFTPSGSVRLSSDRVPEDYIELGLGYDGLEPRVVGITRRSWGRRVSESERPIASKSPPEVTEEDVLAFVMRELGPYVER